MKKDWKFSTIGPIHSASKMVNSILKVKINIIINLIIKEKFKTIALYFYILYVSYILLFLYVIPWAIEDACPIYIYILKNKKNFILL